MADENPSDETRENFEFFSNEYAQALQAYEAIEKQASTLMLFGGSGDLRQFLEQFIEMASRTKALADERNEPNFSEWFRELVLKAERLRQGL